MRREGKAAAPRRQAARGLRAWKLAALEAREKFAMRLQVVVRAYRHVRIGLSSFVLVSDS